MRIAVISDIHSNIYALDKVIDDIKSKNVDMVVCTGDLVGMERVQMKLYIR